MLVTLQSNTPNDLIRTDLGGQKNPFAAKAERDEELRRKREDELLHTPCPCPDCTGQTPTAPTSTVRAAMKLNAICATVLKPGDHIAVKGAAFENHGIFTGSAVIHYSGKSIFCREKEVRETCLFQFCYRDTAVTPSPVQYDVSTFSPQDTIAVARRLWRTQNWAEFGESSEGLALYCKIGSPQGVPPGKVGSIAGASIATGAGMGAGAHIAAATATSTTAATVSSTAATAGWSSSVFSNLWFTAGTSGTVGGTSQLGLVGPAKVVALAPHAPIVCLGLAAGALVGGLVWGGYNWLRSPATKSFVLRVVTHDLPFLDEAVINSDASVGDCHGPFTCQLRSLGDLVLFAEKAVPGSGTAVGAICYFNLTEQRYVALHTLKDLPSCASLILVRASDPDFKRTYSREEFPDPSEALSRETEHERFMLELHAVLKFTDESSQEELIQRILQYEVVDDVGGRGHQIAQTAEEAAALLEGYKFWLVQQEHLGTQSPLYPELQARRERQSTT
eukprot:TRINITY_DN20545_c0_g1_i1.p1 TRINITY_DN20545_c0_g1~~TRINITY_DN20545_c0_g1_i1.p1  ORF type:complete len:505 (+),score=64.04 TRINITY_DN20545_c0_g1_i1:40-1554(+)